jgi:hypothetical protein
MRRTARPRVLALGYVLLILISTTLLVAAMFGLSMCRLAALSDKKHAIAWAEWIATSYLTEHKAVSTDSPREQLPFDSRDDAFRATG